MYIALEGIKGSGKSSILKNVFSQVKMKYQDANLFQITGAMPANHPIEEMSVVYPYLKEYDPFIENLFAMRASWHNNHLPNNPGLIIGDRSIITSYVTRWHKWGDPYYTIKRVESMNKQIRKPDVIIWLKYNPEKALRNIRSREPKHIGIADENMKKLKEANEIYYELLSGRLYKKRIAKSDIIMLDADTNVKDLSKEIYSIIKYYK